MFQKIDRFFLSHFEKMVSHPLQRLTGKTNFYYAGLCSFLIAFIFLGVYFDILPKGLIGEDYLLYNRLKEATWFWWVIVFLFSAYSLLWKMHEALVYTQLDHGTANILKVKHAWRFVRNLYAVIFLFNLLLPNPETNFGTIVVALIFLFLFFISCDPLPPCKGKVKEWIESFGKKPALAAIKTGE